LSSDPGNAQVYKYGGVGIKSIKKLIIMSSTTATAASANTFKGFWMTHHNLRRHPFAAPGTPAKTNAESFWGDFKGFFQMRQKFGRHPFATQV
jgi:hypothetical protein